MNSKEKNEPRKVAVVLVDRANYGRLKPVMKAMQQHPGLRMQVVIAGTMVLDRFDSPHKMLKRDGFSIDSEIYLELEGSLPVTMAKSVGFGIIEFANEFKKLNPDIVLVIGDRYEALSATIAAAYLNLCIVHVQGGEVSGSIDESARHAMSKFAHYHFPSTARAARYLIQMGEDPQTILGIGCPSGDIALHLTQDLSDDMINQIGSGAEIDVCRPYCLAVFHPTTTEFGDESEQMQALFSALEKKAMQTIMLWPNIDAGSDKISKIMRTYRTTYQPNWLRCVTNLSPELYLKVLAQASCAIGNSSSFVRDASFFGTPVVLVGQRQQGREMAAHVLCAEAEPIKLLRAMDKQLSHGRYPCSYLYGDGLSSQRLTQALVNLVPYVQKKLHYVVQEENAVKTLGCTESLCAY